MSSRPNETFVYRDSESQETFQKFLYELFEKNGILSNLRAHLRSNIVEVLRSAQSGNSLPTQKKFTQRLELQHQALNILIVEHLISLEFNYTLSVFISEIPLANMVFDFAKSLFDGTSIKQNTHPRFKENDIWSVLNSLGVKCDSEFASNILEMYQTETNASLLLCILKYMPYYYKNKESITANYPAAQTSEAISSESTMMHPGTRDVSQQRLAPPSQRGSACRHMSSCSDCKKRIQKFKKKTLEMLQREKASSAECFMRSVEVAERHIMEEMFDQIKVVYEAEVEMYKSEEEKRLKRCLINHAKLLKQRRDEMEENFRKREADLFHNVNQKKKFLWGLASSLRTQHAQMSQAMMDVRRQTELLAEKEDNIRSQLIDAEKSLKTRGEEMRSQISDELQTLERHLENLKMEREKINNERNQIEQLKTVCEKAEKIASQEHLNANNSSNFDVLKNEIATLKRYLENTKPPKSYMETGTLTDNSSMASDSAVTADSGLNNEQNDRNGAESEGRSEKQLNKVVNDLKKPKNVNFCQRESLSEVYRELLTNASSTTDAVEILKIENEQLKSIAKQQKSEIESLVQQQAELQARVGRLTLRENSLWRPRTAPPTLNLSTNGSTTFGPHKGAGEQLSTMCLAVQPRVYGVSEPVPFITVPDKKTDGRRYLISQWRKLRRLSPPSPKQHRSRTVNKASTSREHDPGLLEEQINDEERTNRNACKAHKEDVQRQKSPNTILQEAKKKLKNKDRVKKNNSPRRKSPSTMLREAKMRLRKLEMQAEEVEQCYLKFTNRNNTCDGTPTTSEKLIEDYKRISAYMHSREAIQSLQLDYNRYLSQTNLNLGDTYFKNRNTASQITNPIPLQQDTKSKENYIDIPMAEFRKLYCSLEVESNNNDCNSKTDPNNSARGTDTSVSDDNNTGEAIDNNAKLFDDKESHEDDIQKEDNLEQANVEIDAKEQDSDSNPSVSKDESPKTELLKPSLSDKETRSENLNNDDDGYFQDNKQDIQKQEDLDFVKFPSEKQAETSTKSDQDSKSQLSELSNTNNFLRVEINSVSETEKSIKSAKLKVVVKSTLNQSDKDENQVTVVSPASDSYDIGRSETYHNLFDQDLSVGGVKDDGLASEDNANSENYEDDFTNLPSDCPSPIPDDDNFFGN